MKLKEELALQKQMEEQREEILRKRDQANHELASIETLHSKLEKETDTMQRRLTALESVRQRMLEDIGEKRIERKKRLSELDEDEKKLSERVGKKNVEIVELNRQTTELETKLFVQRDGIIKEVKKLEELKKKVQIEKERYKVMEKKKKTLEQQVNIAHYEYSKVKMDTEDRYNAVQEREESLVKREEAMVRRESDVQILVARLKKICEEENIRFNITL